MGRPDQGAAPIDVYAAIDPGQAERLATWLFDRFLSLEASAGEPAPLHGWGAQPAYQIGGYRFVLRTPGAEVDALLAPVLAPLRSGLPGLPPRAWDVVRDLDGLALLDPRGARRFRGEPEALSRVLLALLAREAALANGELGWLEAALVRRGGASALLLLPRAGGRALLEQLQSRGIERSAEPVHLRVGPGLVAAASPSAAGAAPSLLVRVRFDAGPVLQQRLTSFDACAAIFDAAPDELRAHPQTVARLVEWLAQIEALELTAPDLDRHADALAALLA